MDGSDDEYYYVEKILQRSEYPRLRYLVKWEGYDVNQATWEPIENLENVIDIVEEYERDQKARTASKKTDEQDINRINTADNSADYKDNSRSNNKSFNEKKDHVSRSREEIVAPFLSNLREELMEDEIPIKIMTVKNISNKLYCLVKFQEGSDGVTQSNLYVPSSYIADNFPTILIDFYESKIQFRN